MILSSIAFRTEARPAGRADGDTNFLADGWQSKRQERARAGRPRAPPAAPAPSLPRGYPLPRAQVRALAADPKYAKLHELLTIFACRGLDDYVAFSAANADFVASIGVDHESSLRTMRLLTLCSLASGKSTLTYEAIATALAVREKRRAGRRRRRGRRGAHLMPEFSAMEIPR